MVIATIDRSRDSSKINALHTDLCRSVSFLPGDAFGSVMPPVPQDKLVEHYKIAIDEYRYNVRLNWDRTQYFLTLNLAIVAAATGLVKAGQTSAEYMLIGCIFVCGLMACTL